MTVSVANLPQVPFEEFNLHLFASDRGLVATPTRCTIYTSEALLVPWNDQLAPQTSQPIVQHRLGPARNAMPWPASALHAAAAGGHQQPDRG